MISSENEWKYEEVAQDVAYTTLLAFNDINAAHLLRLLESFDMCLGIIRYLLCKC